MATLFEKISGNDAIFNGSEYRNDALLFNYIESARFADDHDIYSDHKNAIILLPHYGSRVWIWTSSAIKSDTAKLIDICRFLRDASISKPEIYLKHEVSDHFSDLYALASLEYGYVVKDEFSLAAFVYEGGKQPENDEGTIIHVDKNNPDHVRLVTEFYRACCEEFHWQDKLDKKVQEYLDMQLYAYVKDGRMLANAVIGGHTDHYIRLKSIAVLAEERRKNIGYQMCCYIINRILDCDKKPVLYTHVKNAAAMALFKKSGFRMHDKIYLIKTDETN
ncbi:MAG: GNAT family N-acetyltransferase [Clostridia bacterium]|nr:GNAT family N-acetyltransferase [Clostridia bacterium]